MQEQQRWDLDDFQVAPLSLPHPLWASEPNPCSDRVVKVGAQPEALGTGRWPVGTPPSNLRLAGTFLAWRSAATSAIKRSTPTTLWIVWSFASISRTPSSRFFSLSTARLEPTSSPSLLDLPIFCFSPHLRSVQLLQNPSLSTCGTTPRDETPPYLVLRPSRHLVRCPLVCPCHAGPSPSRHPLEAN